MTEPTPKSYLAALQETMRDFEARGLLAKPETKHRTYVARAVTFEIDGVPFPVEPISWNYRAKEPPIAPRFLHDDGPSTYTFSCSMTMPMKRRAWKRFQRLLSKPRWLHLSFATLLRRASYGGRKGRRAMRRLMAMSDSTWKEGLADRSSL